MKLEKGLCESLSVVLDIVVRAKEKGMMDHREARQIWLSALKDFGIEVQPTVVRPRETF